MSLQQKRIFVVDDNHDSADSMAMLLQVLGADVTVAYDGKSALEKLQTNRPAVVLLDIGMPEMDGYEVARRIREESSGAEPVLIALSGWSGEEDRKRAVEAGFNYHLVKPVDFDQLQQLLTSLT